MTPQRGFPKSEYEARLARAQVLMREQELAGMLLTTESDVRYFSGFLTLFWQSPTRPWFLFVPADGEPVAVIPEIGADLMRQTWVKDIRTWSAPNPNDDGISVLRGVLQPYARTGGRIGIPMGHETYVRMPMIDFERLQGTIDFEDCTEIVRALRMEKSDGEIEKIAHICNIGSTTFAQAPQFVQLGQSLSDTFREFRRTCLANGADDVPYLVGGADAGGYSDIIAPPTDRALATGDILMIDTGSVFDGYFCDFDRNFAVGNADPAAARAYEVLYKATDAGLNAARPGATCRDLFDAMHGVIVDFNSNTGSVGRMGHGLGMQLTEWPSHARFDDTVLTENMVLTLEPSLNYGDGRMMVHEENIVIRNGAPQLLSTRAPAELPVIG